MPVPQHGNPTRHVYAPALIPSRRVEYVYYFALIYSVMADVVGISVGMVAGGMILVLSALCILQLRSCAKAAYAPIGLLLACATSFLLVQIVIHGESILGDSIRSFIIGFLTLIIVQSLRLRAGFLHRYTIVLFVLGVITLPFLTFTPAQIERARVDIQVGGGLSHPYGLAGWFGFCAIYFAIFGLERKRGIVRTVSWVVAVGCLFIVSLTVSRGVLFSSALAITVGFRGLLRRGFVPLLLLLILALVIYESGLFAHVFSYYAERGMEETGRELLWPAAIEQIFASNLTTLVGVGISNTRLYMPGSRFPTSPHNSFLSFALSSGVLPLAFFVAFWIRAAWTSFSDAERHEYAPFRIPFLLYIFIAMMLNDLVMSPWGILALSIGAGLGISYRTDRLLLVNRIGGRQTAQLLARRSEAAKPMARYRS